MNSKLPDFEIADVPVIEEEKVRRSCKIIIIIIITNDALK